MLMHLNLSDLLEYTDWELQKWHVGGGARVALLPSRAQVVAAAFIGIPG